MLTLHDGTHKQFEEGKRDGYKGKEKQSDKPEYLLGYTEGITLRIIHGGK